MEAQWLSEIYYARMKVTVSELLLNRYCLPTIFSNLKKKS